MNHQQRRQIFPCESASEERICATSGYVQQVILLIVIMKSLHLALQKCSYSVNCCVYVPDCDRRSYKKKSYRTPSMKLRSRLRDTATTQTSTRGWESKNAKETQCWHTSARRKRRAVLKVSCH